MIEAIKIWNEPNNLSHWDFLMDEGWREFGEMVKLTSRAVRETNPELTIVLGGMSPIDPNFLRALEGHGALEGLDAVAIHGFPLDWNHWQINEWPIKVDEIRALTQLPVWITEVGVSTFGADEVQEFGLKRTQDLLAGRVDRVFWYSLLDLPQAWGATTRHREAEGSSYYRHFYMGLIRADGTEKPAFRHFNPEFGICQWFHFEDPRLDFAVEKLRALGVKRLRTGISWADWLRPGGPEFYDHMMERLAEFDVTATLCFTPESKGKRPDHTSPPKDPAEFAEFARTVVARYAPAARPDACAHASY